MTYLVVKAESTKIESPYLNEKEQKLTLCRVSLSQLS